MTGRDEALRAFLSDEIRSGAMPSAAWWVGDRGGVLSHGVLGHAVLIPHKEPARDDTPYDLASLTKPLATALSALALESDRRLGLDEPLDEAFPQLRASPFAGATLRDAAAHRARLPAWMPLYAAGSSREAYLTAIAAAPPGPADATVYSDLGYLLLGFALESAAGRSLDLVFDDRIAQPLGLNRCGFPGSGSGFSAAAATERGNAYERRLAGESTAGYPFRTAMIRGHVHDGNAWALGGVAGHAGLFATPAAVGAIAGAILDPATIGLPTFALTAMLRPASERTGSRTFGFLRAADAESVRGILPSDAIGHFGFTGTSIWIDPARPRVYVLLTNRVHPDVPGVDFTRTRRGFHERAAAL